MRPLRSLLVACLLASLALVGGACGAEEEEGHSREGEPLEVGELAYNIQITRFLNPDDAEDAEYLVGLPDPAPGSSYLGVFLVIENEGDEPRPSATQYAVTDTLENEFESVEGESPYALEIGAEVPADGQLPLPNTTAATGPNQGSLLIFEVADEVSENRPLTLQIESFDGSGEVTLDI